MSNKKIIKEVLEGKQKTLNLVQTPKRKFIEIEITPEIRIIDNVYMTSSGNMGETIIKVPRLKNKNLISVISY